METSNIVVGSNVFLCRTEYSFQDPEFVKQVQDYELLKYIESRNQVDNLIAPFQKEQISILNTEMRCIYAKNDPCWGYKKTKGKVVCACINERCPLLKECNPDYSRNNASYWMTSEVESSLYGRPDQLPRYYIVDMISDKEMNQYVVDPGNDGIDHKTPPAAVYRKPEPEPKYEKYKIDPNTGRKMVVTGYKRLKYPEEDGLCDPIWGFVEDVGIEKTLKVIRKAKKIEKKRNIHTIKKPILKMETEMIDSDYVNKVKYKRAVTTHIIEEIKLTDFREDCFIPNDTVIFFDNPAEMAFVSGTLLVEGIAHGYDDGDVIILSLVDDYKKYSKKKCVFISSEALKNGCNEKNIKAWKVLAENNEIYHLKISDRDYYKFLYTGSERWTCRNMYGVTHVCVVKEDIKEIEKLEDGLYPVSLLDDGDSYMILKKNGELLGKLGMTFVKLIKSLKEMDQISSLPQEIKGISLKVVGGKTEILGMGHLKFIEY